MNEGLWEQLKVLETERTARRAGCRWQGEAQAGCYVIGMLNREYRVELDEGRIFAVGGAEQEAGFPEQLCILAYLVGAKDVPLTGKLVRAGSLPGGDFFFRGIHALPADRLANAFGDEPAKLYGAAERLGGVKRDYGDAGVAVALLPRIPLTIVIWGKDDEFEARSSILFDSSAGEHMGLDALGGLVNLAVEEITSGCGISPG